MRIELKKDWLDPSNIYHRAGVVEVDDGHEEVLPEFATILDKPKKAEPKKEKLDSLLKKK